LIEFFVTNKSFALAAAAITLATAAALVLFLIRSLTGRRLQLPRNGRPRPVRLGIVDAFRLDGQRQLVIVRRDSVEHLLMIGGPNDLLIESQIIRSENRDSRNYREGKFRDKEFREWEPGEPALSPPGSSSPLPAEEDLPALYSSRKVSPPPAGDEEAVPPNEALGSAGQKWDPVLREGRRRNKNYEPYDAAWNHGSGEPVPSETAFDLTAAKSHLPPTPSRRSPPDSSHAARMPAKRESNANPGSLPNNRQMPTNLGLRAVRPPAAVPIQRPLTQRQAQDEASRVAPVRAPQVPLDGPSGFSPGESKEVFGAQRTTGLADAPAAAPQAPADVQASLFPSPDTRFAPRVSEGPQGAESLELEIARILGRQLR
jgi:hypothetical protein